MKKDSAKRILLQSLKQNEKIKIAVERKEFANIKFTVNRVLPASLHEYKKNVLYNNDNELWKVISYILFSIHLR